MEEAAVKATQSVVLLVVEDDKAMRSLLCDELWDLGYRIVEAEDGDEALQLIAERCPDLILTDLRMPAGGLDYLARIRTLAPVCPVILMTAFGSSETRTRAVEAGVAAYFDKPVRIAELKAAIQRLLERDGHHSPTSSMGD
jgi:CheY-like chemotaxis protein